MPSALRAQVALWGMLACLLIPIGVSNLRGLTHILTCKEESATDFSIQVDDQGRATLGGATSFERDDDTDESTAGDELCGGLVLDITLASNRPGAAQMEFAITNNTEYGWHGSVQVDLGSTPIPIDIGEVEPGETATDSVDLDLDADSSYEIEGSLLIGP
jgi:hypothetical protein